jgi:predicted RNase H-like HicB family nuclease
MHLTVQLEQEEDGRWLGEVSELPGAMAYGSSRDDALAAAEALALRILAEMLEQGELSSDDLHLTFRLS